MKRRARVGVVGCGMIAQLMHLPYLTELRDRFTTVAVCDRAGDLARRVAARFGVPHTYGSCEQMLDAHPDIDAVLVLNRDHFEVAYTALERGKHTFTEKPLCYTEAEARRLVDLSRRTGAKLMVGYMKRHDSGVQRGLEEIRRIDKPLMARVHLVVGPDHGNWIVPQVMSLDRPAGPVDTSDADGRRPKVLRELGPVGDTLFTAYMNMFGVWSHDINMYRAAFPGSPDSIKAHVSPDGSVFCALLQYEDGFQTVFQCGATTVRRFEEELTVWGTDRVVALEISNPFLRHTPSRVRVTRDDTAAVRVTRDDTAAAVRARSAAVETLGTVVEQTVTGSYDEPFRAQLRHFHDCVTTAARPVTSGADALADIQLMTDMIRAATPGAP
ncbi:Gfo/Idh/MocA family protein [Streptomyces aureocirculatus]|uniref:Gfo/Idh/MocA family protein n=1 Tax=Streptomyces aureocirculatus TaxID=67275 RepID=UPI0004C4E2D6|nr:Gfo/Idh/MocA family oxidoreductase [Streptomyces aureocirculatus]